MGRLALKVTLGTRGDTGDKGDTGAAGQNGTNGIVIQTVTLCGSTQPHAEVALHVNGQWLVYFENGNGSNRRLTTLVPGSYYVSTDGFQQCVFTTSDLDRMLQ